MSKSLQVLTLDPGEKVGWARAMVQPDGAWHNLVHGITPLQEMALALDKKIGTYDVVIYETWRLYPAAAKFLIGNDMQSSQFVGMVRLLSWTHPHIKLVSQGASVMKTARKTAPSWLQEILDNEPATHDDGHNVSALLHMWAWTWENYTAKGAL